MNKLLIYVQNNLSVFVHCTIVIHLYIEVMGHKKQVNAIFFGTFNLITCEFTKLLQLIVRVAITSYFQVTLTLRQFMLHLMKPEST